MRTRIFLLLALAMLSIESSAQKMLTASGTYSYHLPKSVTVEQGENIAFERLQVQMIAENFGTIVGMSNFTRVENTDGKSRVEMLSLGKSEVRGEWIETVSGPEYSYEMGRDGSMVITVSATGRIREIRTAPLEFKAKVLRNGLTERHEDYEFIERDRMFLSFQSPQNGFLAVYLYDGDETVYRLLPYKYQADVMKVEADRPYVLFSMDKADYGVDSYLVDEYELTAAGSMEQNVMYVIYSPNEFYNAGNVSRGEDLVPPTMDYASFYKWLVRCRKHDPEMRVEEKTIIIKKP